MNSRDYWKQRELENIAKDYIDDAKTAHKIREIYKVNLEEIRKEINSFYQKYATTEGISLSATRKRINKFDVESFETMAKKFVESKDFSEGANRKLRLYNATMRINRLEMLKSKIGLHTLSLAADERDVIYNSGREMMLKTYRRQAGLLGDSVDADQYKRVDEILKASFNGAKYSEEIWGKLDDRITNGSSVLHSSISNMLEQYLINGKGSISLSSALKTIFNTSANAAERLARTEIRRMQTAVQEDVMREYGFTQYKFIAEPTACPLCKPLDDEVFDLKDLQVGENASPIHPNCRCSITPYMGRK